MPCPVSPSVNRLINCFTRCTFNNRDKQNDSTPKLHQSNNACHFREDNLSVLLLKKLSAGDIMLYLSGNR
jgi:hypothetical protein